jgi:lysophospholipase L1-like esterase
MDPMTALAAVQSAVALVKKVSKTVDDVTSLGPVLGKYFDAKTNASKAAVAAKKSGKSSSMGAAIQIEMALEQTAQFERELQLLFMQAGKIDVWNKIKARAAAMDLESAHEAKRVREEHERRRKAMSENIELAIGIILIVAICVGAVWLGFELIKYCKAVGCGR